jgi:hypothetical protein
VSPHVDVVTPREHLARELGGDPLVPGPRAETPRQDGDPKHGPMLSARRPLSKGTRRGGHIRLAATEAPC